MFPQRAQALAWVNLEEVRLHVGLIAAAVVAMEDILGSFGNRIANVAVIPESVWRRTAAAALVEIEQAVCHHSDLFALSGL